MKRILALIAILLSASVAVAAPEMIKDKNVATNIGGICFYNSSTGALIDDAAGVDCEYSQYSDSATPGTYADFAGAEVEIATDSECFYVPASAAEMNADYVDVKCKSSSTNAMPVTLTVNTTTQRRIRQLADARGTAQAATGTTLQLAAAETFADDELNCNTTAYIVSATAGAGQSGCITDYTGATDTATVPTWVTTPTGTITYDLLSTPKCCMALDSTGRVTVASIANDAVSAAAIANGAIDAATFASGAIDATAIATDAIGAAELAASAIGAAELATDSITSDELATTALAEFITVNTGTTSASAVEGSVAKETSDLITPSGSCTISAGGITAASFAAGAIDATAIAADAIGASEVAAGAIGASELATDAIGADELAAGGLAEFITVNTGTTSASAVEGSVSKETADLVSTSASCEISAGGITAASFAAGAIDAAAIAADAIGASEIAADAIGASELATNAADEVVQAVWNEPRTGNTTAGTFGIYLDAQITGVAGGGGGGACTSIADGAISSTTFAAGAITAAAIAADALGASELATNAVDEIVQASWNESRSGNTAAGSFGLFLDQQVSGVSGGSGGGSCPAATVY